MSAARLSHVQRLIGLARSNGVDVRLTLLRLIVDQFVAEPHHAAAEVTRFGELVLNLLGRAEEADRAVVAEKLAGHPETPAAVARRLAADTAAVARPILERSPALSDDDLFLAVRSGDIDKALAVARREDIGLPALVALEEMDDPRVKAALAARVEPPVPRADGRSGAEAPADLGAAFLAGSAARRESIIAGLALRPPPSPGQAPDDPDRTLELAALSRREGALCAAVAAALGVGADIARRIAGDAGGEPLIVAARALDLGREAAIRVLLFAHGADGLPVDRIRGLARLYDALPRPAALAIVRSWRAAGGGEAAPARPRAARHQPALAPDAPDRHGARQAASPPARPAPRPSARPDIIRKPGG